VITIIGWIGNRPESLTGDQREVLAHSTVIFARAQLHASLAGLAPRAMVIDFVTPFHTTVEAVIDQPGDCTVIASGDPNFFGITRSLQRARPGVELTILPAPTSVATLAARIGRPWDDLAIVSLVGRDQTVSLDRAHRQLESIPSGAIALLLPPDTTFSSLC
jgi:precorrin-6Y C5,15-methyltransferase (decarboxylating)